MTENEASDLHSTSWRRKRCLAGDAADGISESVYRIKEGPISETESWEFQPGVGVKVERRGFADKKDGLFAIELVQR